MRLIHIVLVVLLLIGGLIGWILVSPEPPMSTGGPHPDIEGMNIGGDGLARLGPIFSLGFTLQALFVILIHLLVALSVAERNRTSGFWMSLVGAGLVSMWVCWKIFSSYAEFLETGVTGYFLGFPIASAWMMFGIWLAGALLAIIYVVGFRRFVFTLEDEAAYDLLEAEAETRRASSPESPHLPEPSA